MDEEKQSPFVAAKWKGAKCESCGEHGKTLMEGSWEDECPDCNGTGHVPYDLKGLKWTPEPEYGMVVIRPDGNLSKALDDATLRMSPEGNPPRITTVCLPLLLSPAGLTREVAIAALERAGFKRSDKGLWCIEIGNLLITCCEHLDVFFTTDGDTDDPTLAQYAVDCFKVLKQWADAVEWGAK